MTAFYSGFIKKPYVAVPKVVCAPVKPVVKPADCAPPKVADHQDGAGGGFCNFKFIGVFKPDCAPAPVKPCEKPAPVCKPEVRPDKCDRDDRDDDHDHHGGSQGNGHDTHGGGYGHGHHKGDRDKDCDDGDDDDDSGNGGCNTGGCGSGGGTTPGACDPSAPFTTINGTANADTLVGTAGNNSINGLAGNDSLDGGDGVDVLKGGAGTDVLNGGACGDTLAGGTDVDVLTGGAGADTFLFDTALSEDVSDLIMDFTVGSDKIAVAQSLTNIATKGAIDVNIFTLGSAGISGEDRFILDDINGVLYYDADGDGDSPNLQVATFAAGTTVTAGDIVIV